MQEKDFQIKDQYRYPKGHLGRQVAKQMNQGHKPLTLWGLTKIKIASNNVILDVGCGGGKTLTRLAQIAPHGKVFGIDHSPDMVEYSKKVNQKLMAQDRVQIVLDTVEKMSFKDNFFDLVTAFETYYFWSNFHDALTEIKRVLKPRGRLCLVNEMVKDRLWDVENAKLIAETHVHLIPLQRIQGLMYSIGFADVQVFTKNKSPWNAVIAQK
jgi:ubiquinone/menaquinone biosynthesis C-methylase UbiE